MRLLLLLVFLSLCLWPLTRLCLFVPLCLGVSGLSLPLSLSLCMLSQLGFVPCFLSQFPCVSLSPRLPSLCLCLSFPGLSDIPSGLVPQVSHPGWNLSPCSGPWGLCSRVCVWGLAISFLWTSWGSQRQLRGAGCPAFPSCTEKPGIWNPSLCCSSGSPSGKSA